MVRAGFTQTEFDEIPKDWTKISIGSDASLNARIGWQALTTNEYETSGDYYLVTGTDFIGGRVNWDTCHFISKWRYSQDKKIQLKNGDVLITKDGTIGKAGYVEDLYLPATLNSGVFVIRPLENKFVPLFLYYTLTSRVFDEFLNRITAGSTITHLYQKDFVNFEFYAPEVKEQEEIAEALSDVDGLISALEKQIAKKKDIKAAAMQQLLTGKKRLPGFGGGNGYKQTEFGLIPEDWEIFDLADVMQSGLNSIKIGPFGSALKAEFLTKTGYKVYGQENVFESNMELGSRYICDERYQKLKSCKLECGDFLISMMGTIGKTFIVPHNFDPGIMDSHLIRLKINSTKLCPNLLTYLFKSPIIFKQIDQLSVGGIMDGLSSKIIKSLLLPLPRIEEQRAIAEIFMSMDDELKSLIARLTKTKMIKQGMMQELLTGKTRLI
ncbi:MAG: restriction endonuclease subunit S [Emcibacteraceae bacterium]